MVSPALRPLVSAALAAALVGALAGCTAEPPHAATSSPTGTPSASATADPVVAPEPRLDLTCDQLLAGSAASIVGYAPQRETLIDDRGAHQDLQLRQLGALSCTWSNGVPPSLFASAGRKSIDITVVAGPDAPAKWARYIAVYGHPGDAEASYCYAYDGTAAAFCNHDTLAGEIDGGAWVTISISGVADGSPTTDAGVESLVRPLIEHVVSAVTAAGRGASAFVPPAGTTPLSRQCTDYLDPTFVASTVGVPSLEIFEFRDGPQVGALIGLDGTTFAPYCNWLLPNSDSGVGGMHLWSGGEWAFRAATAASTTLHRIPTDGDGELWIDCAAGSISCFAHLVVDHNWIALELGPESVDATGPHYAYTADTETALRTLGTALLTRLDA